MNVSHRVCVYAAAVLAAAAAIPSAARAGVNKSLVIAVDGVRSDALITAATPNLDRLMDGTFGGGAYSGAYAHYAQTIQDAPTSSLYMHPAIMTGVSYTTHGGDYTTYPHYLTTLESGDSSLNTAYLVSWTPDLSIPSGADYIKDSTDIGNTARAVGMMEGMFSDPGGDGGTSWTMGTEPDALFIFYLDTDVAGHTYGFSPASFGYISAIQQADARIGQILTAVQARPTFAAENWQIVVTTDHGGQGTEHGPQNPHCETIPFIVAGKSVQQGQLAGTPIHYDVPPTAVKHMLGAGSVPGNYEGQAQGDSVQTKGASLIDGLVAYVPFEGGYDDVSGRGNDASIGPGSDHDPVLHAGGGKFGGYVEINDLGGGASDSSYLTLGKPGDLDFGTDTSFTIAMWYRAQGNQSGTPVIIGNKNWNSGYNPGTALLANEADGDDFGLNIADTSGSRRRDIEPVDYGPNAWWFLAATLDRGGSGTLYVGAPDGVFWLISDFISDLGDVNSVLPWNIGQDGMGTYSHNLDADLDDLAVWRRALWLDELLLLYNDGAGTELAAFFPIPGDANLDHLVDIQDFFILKDHFDQDPADWADGNFNQDTVVDIQDFYILKDHFDQSNPEPASATLLLIGLPWLACLAGRRVRRRSRR